MTTIVRAIVLAGVLVCASSCNNLQGLTDNAPPLVTFNFTVSGDTTPFRPAGIDSDRALQVALVWGEQWLTEPFCILPAANPDAAKVIAAGCRDPFGFVASRVGADVPVTLGVQTSISLRDLPSADLMVGDITSRVAYASLVLYDDRDGDGTLDLALSHRLPGAGPGPPQDDTPDSSDIVYGASFLTMTAADQRISYLEGTFTPSAFYPRSGCDDPSPGFNILSAGGFTYDAGIASIALGHAACRGSRELRQREADGRDDHLRRSVAGDRRRGRLHGTRRRQQHALSPATVRQRARLHRPPDRVRASAVVRRGRSNGSDPAGGLGPAHRSLQGPDPLHAARLPKQRGLHRSAMGLHREPAALVAVHPVKRRSLSRRLSARWSIIGVALALTAAHGALAAAPGGSSIAGAPGGSGLPPPPLTAGAPAGEPANDKDDGDEGEPRLSLPTEADRDAWLRPGFRMGLGIVYGQLSGLDGAPSGRLRGATLRLGLRLDADWSVLASFQYALAQSAGGLDGLRFSGTIDPTWHVTRHLSLAVGFGFGGIVEGSTGRPDVMPLPSTLNTSYTLPGASPPLPSCSGVGATGLARAEWVIVIGPRAATSFTVEAMGQWTGCVADTGNVEVDTGQAIVRRQWWPHAGATVGWGMTWR